MTRQTLTQERLKELVSYSELTGVFIWIKPTGNKINAGDIAGCLDKQNGYRVLNVDGTQHLEHRLAWLYVHGELPKEQIDHKSHKRTDNRISNLRVVTPVDNNRNKSKSKRNTSGHNGVYWDSKNKNWRARIKVNGKTIGLGSYKKIEDAVIARKEGDQKYGFHDNHGG